jgi:hypothetical protein
MLIAVDDGPDGGRLKTISLSVSSRGDVLPERDAVPLRQSALEQLYEAMVVRLSASGIGLAGAKPEELALRWT